MSYKVIQDSIGRGLQAGRTFKAGEQVIELAGSWVNTPSRYTIQLGHNRHLMPDDHLWALINHSCEPNLIVDPDRQVMIAYRDIHAGEALSFDYQSTEWEMAEPFHCCCNAPSCEGLIAGARYRLASKHKGMVWEQPSRDSREARTKIAA